MTLAEYLDHLYGLQFDIWFVYLIDLLSQRTLEEITSTDCSLKQAGI